MSALQPQMIEGACTGFRDRGFSLIELLAVVTIMGVLASIALPLAELAHQRSNEEELRRSLREIRSAIDSYKYLADQGNIFRSADDSGYPPSLQVLVVGVTDAKSPKGQKIYLLRKLPRDPFAPENITDPAKTWALRSYESPPEDPKPGRDVFDVHSMSQATALDGRAYRDW